MRLLKPLFYSFSINCNKTKRTLCKENMSPKSLKLCFRKLASRSTCIAIAELKRKEVEKKKPQHQGVLLGDMSNLRFGLSKKCQLFIFRESKTRPEILDPIHLLRSYFYYFEYSFLIKNLLYDLWCLTFKNHPTKQ